jgi:hypothetical protein
MPFKTQKRLISGTKAARRVAQFLIDRSCWFAVKPLPDDGFTFEFKPGEGIDEAIVQLIRHESL